MEGGGSPPCPARVAGGAVGGCHRARLRAAGWRRVPTGLEDVSTYPALVAELLARNWTEVEVKAALAENLLRVFKKVEEVSGEHRAVQGMGTHRAWGHAGQQRQVGHQDIRHLGMYEDTQGRG